MTARDCDEHRYRQAATESQEKRHDLHRAWFGLINSLHAVLHQSDADEALGDAIEREIVALAHAGIDEPAERDLREWAREYVAAKVTFATLDP